MFPHLPLANGETPIEPTIARNPSMAFNMRLKTSTPVKKIIFFVIFFAVFSFPGHAFSSDAYINNVRVSYGPPLRFSFTVFDAFTKEIEDAVKSGAAASFTFIVELDRVNSVWFNEEVKRLEFRHTVKYDSMKEEYEVLLEETGMEPLRTKDFGEMKMFMTSCREMLLQLALPLESGAEYEMRLKAELKTLRLPFPLDYALFFLKFWDVETGWYEFRFSPKAGT